MAVEPQNPIRGVIMNQTVEAGSLITLHYRISTAAGAELVSTFGTTPATLQLGKGELLPALERCLVGVKVAERSVFQLEAQQAFGDYNPALVERMPLSDFPMAEPVEVGSVMEFTAPEGSKFVGLVRELEADTAVVDFNHPLAGKAIRFEVEVIGIL